jgi:hypothetical protein
LNFQQGLGIPSEENMQGQLKEALRNELRKLVAYFNMIEKTEKDIQGKQLTENDKKALKTIGLGSCIHDPEILESLWKAASSRKMSEAFGYLLQGKGRTCSGLLNALATIAEAITDQVEKNQLLKEISPGIARDKIVMDMWRVFIDFAFLQNGIDGEDAFQRLFFSLNVSKDYDPIDPVMVKAMKLLSFSHEQAEKYPSTSASGKDKLSRERLSGKIIHRMDIVKWLCSKLQEAAIKHGNGGTHHATIGFNQNHFALKLPVEDEDCLSFCTEDLACLVQHNLSLPTVLGEEWFAVNNIYPPLAGEGKHKMLNLMRHLKDTGGSLRLLQFVANIGNEILTDMGKRSGKDPLDIAWLWDFILGGKPPKEVSSKNLGGRLDEAMCLSYFSEAKKLNPLASSEMLDVNLDSGVALGLSFKKVIDFLTAPVNVANDQYDVSPLMDLLPEMFFIDGKNKPNIPLDFIFDTDLLGMEPSTKFTVNMHYLKDLEKKSLSIDNFHNQKEDEIGFNKYDKEFIQNFFNRVHNSLVKNKLGNDLQKKCFYQIMLCSGRGFLDCFLRLKGIDASIVDWQNIVLNIATKPEDECLYLKISLPLCGAKKEAGPEMNFEIFPDGEVIIREFSILNMGKILKNTKDSFGYQEKIFNENMKRIVGEDLNMLRPRLGNLQNCIPDDAPSDKLMLALKAEFDEECKAEQRNLLFALPDKSIDQIMHMISQRFLNKIKFILVDAKISEDARRQIHEHIKMYHRKPPHKVASMRVIKKQVDAFITKSTLVRNDVNVSLSERIPMNQVATDKSVKEIYDSMNKFLSGEVITGVEKAIFDDFKAKHLYNDSFSKDAFRGGGCIGGLSFGGKKLFSKKEIENKEKAIDKTYDAFAGFLTQGKVKKFDELDDSQKAMALLFGFFASQTSANAVVKNLLNILGKFFPGFPDMALTSLSSYRFFKEDYKTQIDLSYDDKGEIILTFNAILTAEEFAFLERSPGNSGDIKKIPTEKGSGFEYEYQYHIPPDIFSGLFDGDWENSGEQEKIKKKIKSVLPKITVSNFHFTNIKLNFAKGSFKETSIENTPFIASLDEYMSSPTILREIDENLLSESEVSSEGLENPEKKALGNGSNEGKDNIDKFMDELTIDPEDGGHQFQMDLHEGNTD